MKKRIYIEKSADKNHFGSVAILAKGAILPRYIANHDTDEKGCVET